VKKATPDSQIVEACCRNDRRAQEVLYKQFFDPMMVLCMRYTRDQEDAIEVLHSAFLKVFQSIQSFDAAKATLYTWIRTITVRTAIDFLRRRDKMQRNVDLETAADVVIEEGILERLSSQELLKVVRELPETTRAVFNLHAVEGFNHREIGEMLKISEGTSKWHLSEARKYLQQAIQKYARA
jgi:RNA polymerase sigma factor (sigma-70 family)